MGDMRTIIEKATANLEEAGVLRAVGPTRRSRIEKALWVVWEESYRQGYADGQEDAQ